MLAQNETEALLKLQVNSFYTRVRTDSVLGPVFNNAIADWPEHLEKLCDFWTSIVMGSRTYKGQPVPAHRRHLDRIRPEMFDHWLRLWANTATEILPEELASVVIEKSQRIADSLKLAMFFKIDGDHNVTR